VDERQSAVVMVHVTEKSRSRGPKRGRVSLNSRAIIISEHNASAGLFLGIWNWVEGYGEMFRACKHAQNAKLHF